MTQARRESFRRDEPAHGGVRRVILLGSTGSIGRQTIEVIAGLNNLHASGELPWRFEIVGLAAGSNHDAVLAQAAALGVREVAVSNGPSLDAMARQRGLNLRQGPDAAERLVREVECDIVLGAIVGFAGLDATLAAVELGRDVALANKETLVAAGSIVVEAAKRTGSRLLPVDSEHSGVWQCLGGPGGAPGGTMVPPCALDPRCGVSRVILTASGGALRNRTKDATYHATPEDALAHPTWSMGAKVTIDSASLTNKALEVIEAHWLFGLEPARIGVLVHPQSIIHAIVEYADGSSIAQLGAPDMRTPIQYALVWPRRVTGRGPGIGWEQLSKLELSPPDLERFPALALGYRVIEEGGTAGAVFNAANEAAVEAFLARRIPFGKIGELSSAALDEVGVSPLRDLADAREADGAARRFVATRLGGAAVSVSARAGAAAR